MFFALSRARNFSAAYALVWCSASASYGRSNSAKLDRHTLRWHDRTIDALLVGRHFGQPISYCFAFFDCVQNEEFKFNSPKGFANGTV
ncbi:hypothetical protein ACERZ8_20215 [Tateyamaria armeniaca]|uniref:Secreted protein n=1 Tax=Tateyamaria armeniaca TaxID=2518930 RepID=A0ABW8UYP2_9RHOB